MNKQPNDDDKIIRAGDVKPGEPRRIYLTRYGVVINDEHGITMHAKDGSTSHLYADGSSEVKNPHINRIEFDDVLSIREFRTVRTSDTTLHIIEFDSGGVFAYLRDVHGKVIETTLRGGAHSSSDWEGNLRVYGRAPEGDPGGSHA